MNIGLDYTLGLSSGVVITPDDIQGGSETQTHTAMFRVEYVPIEKLAVDLALPLIAIKYTGEMEHMPPGEWDDGDLHAAIQDLEIGASYALLSEPLHITPRLAFIIPIMDYPTQGFAAIGRHLKQVQLGATLARSLDPIAPNLFFQGSYHFTLSERFDETAETEDIQQHRSNLGFMIGYFFLDGALSIGLATNIQRYHGGVKFETFDQYTPDQQMFHDALLDEDFIYVGGDVNYQINDKLSVGVLLRFFVHGSSTRDQNLYGLSFGYKVL
ncbi:MAG: hypothetical protein H0T42_21945 [Deltaproteobacteria bacterium]|nr:hypothetical protein [Deltaproteobacteria bacterium]